MLPAGRLQIRPSAVPSFLAYIEEQKQLPKCLTMSLAAYIAFYSSDIQERTADGLSSGVVLVCIVEVQSPCVILDLVGVAGRTLADQAVGGAFLPGLHRGAEAAAQVPDHVSGSLHCLLFQRHSGAHRRRPEQRCRPCVHSRSPEPMRHPGSCRCCRQDACRSGRRRCLPSWLTSRSRSSCPSA